MSERVKTVDVSDPAVVLDCYRKLNVTYMELKAENETLRRAFHDIYEVYAGCDGLLVETSRAYLEQLLKEMADIAAEHKRAVAAIRE